MKTLLTVATLILATATFAGPEIIRPATGERQTLPCGMGTRSLGLALDGQAIADGWRYLIPAAHGKRYKASTWTDSGTEYRETAIDYTDAEWSAVTNAAAIAAAEAAAAALRPPEFLQGAELPFVVFKTSTNEQRWSLGMLDDGTIVKWQSGNSPWNAATSASNFPAAMATAKTNAVDMRALRLDIAATIDGLQTNVDATVFSGGQRTEFKDLRDLCLDLAREVRRLRKAVAQEAN